jgi:hypothetical protein
VQIVRILLDQSSIYSEIAHGFVSCTKPSNAGRIRSRTLESRRFGAEYGHCVLMSSIVCWELDSSAWSAQLLAGCCHGGSWMYEEDAAEVAVDEYILRISMKPKKFSSTSAVDLM